MVYFDTLLNPVNYIIKETDEAVLLAGDQQDAEGIFDKAEEVQENEETKNANANSPEKL